jgi:thioesterase domain-containing protein
VKPLVVLHGGFGLVGMFEQLLPQLAETQKVIAVELQAHGHTVSMWPNLSSSLTIEDIIYPTFDVQYP